MSEQSGSGSGSKKGRKRRKGAPWWQTSVAAIIAVLVLFGSYFFLQTDRRQSYLDAHHLRLLANAGEGVAQAVDGLHSQVLRAFDDLQVPGTEVRVDDEGVDGRLRLIRGFRRMGTGALDGVPRAKLRLDAGRPAIEYYFEEGEPAFGMVDLDGFLKPYLRSDVFESILVVTDPERAEEGESPMGQVLTQSGPASLRFHQIRIPAKKAEAEEATARRLAGGSDLHTVTIGDERFRLYEQPLRVSLRDDQTGAGGIQTWRAIALLPSATLRAASMKISTNVILSVIGMVVLLALSMPIVRLADQGERAIVRVRDVCTLAMTLVVFAGFGALMLEDATRFQDIRAFREKVQLASLSRDMRASITEELGRMEQQLELLTERWQEEGRLGSTSDAGSESTSPPGTEGGAFQRSEGVGFLRALWGSSTLLLERIENNKASFVPHILQEDVPLRVRPVQVGDPYLSFEKVWWLAGESAMEGLQPGDQVGKWTTRDMTSLLRLADRPYFKELVHGQPHPDAGAGVDETLFQPGRYVQSIRSRTDGRESVVLSKRRADVGRVPASLQESWEVAAIESEVKSLLSPTLPAGFLFAVVDVEGRVLFHSDVENNLIEQAFLEFTPSEVLEAAVATRTVAEFNASYRGGAYSMHVAPIPNLPWSLLVLADKSLIRGQHVEVLGLTLGLFSGQFLLILALVLCTWHLRRGGRPRGSAARFWFWPDPERFGRGLRWISVATVLLVYLTFFDQAQGWERIYRLATVAFLSLTCLEQLFDESARRNSKRLARSLTQGMGPLKAQLLECLSLRTGRTLAFGIALLAWIVVWITVGSGFFSLPVLGISGVLLFLARDAFLSHVAALGLFAAVGGPSAGLERALLCSAVVAALVWLPVPLDRMAGLRTWFDRCKASDRAWVPTYNASLVLAIVLLGIQPVLAFYNTLAGDAAAVHAQLQHEAFVGQLNERSARLGKRYQDVQLTDELREELRRRQFPDEMGDLIGHGGEPTGVFLDGWMTIARPPTQSLAPVPTEVTASMSKIMPFFSERSPIQRQAAKMGRDAVDRERSRYYFDSQAMGVLSSHSDYHHGGAGVGEAGAEEDLWLSSNLSIFHRRNLRRDLLYLVATAALFYALVAFITQRLFLFGPFGAGQRAAVDATGLLDRGHDQLIVGGLPPEARTEGKVLVLTPSMVASTSVESLLEAFEGEEEVIIEGFDTCLGAKIQDEALLDVLETVGVREHKPRILLQSAVDPLHLLTTREHEQPSPENDRRLARWSAVLDRFDKVRLPFHPDGEALSKWKEEMRSIETPEVPAAVAEALIEECSVTQRLRDSAGQLLASPALVNLFPDLVPERVLDAHEPYYRSIWERCNQEERLVLYRLAHHGFVNWKQKNTLQRLIRRGLVIKLPSFALMNDSFRLFVLTAEPRSRIEQWEAEGEAGHLENMGSLLILGLIVLGAFLFITQKETFNQALAIVTALASGTAVLVRVAGMAAPTSLYPQRTTD